MKKLNTMTDDERSLLLFFEVRAVDHGGLVDTIHMNKEDSDIAEKWSKEGFIKYGRIKYHSIIGRTINHWCELSEEAWKLAHAERKARCKRIMSKSTVDKVQWKGEGK